MNRTRIYRAILKKILMYSRLKKSQNSVKWIESLTQMLLDINLFSKKELKDGLGFLEGFAFDNIHLLQKSSVKVRRDDPTLICVMRDERERIKPFFEHYRNLGIKRFVILDNNSVDGTREYLLEQSDTDTFWVKRAFTDGRKQGWINRLLCLYGFDRWYLYVDADELLDWPEKDERSLKDIVNIMEMRGLSRAGAIMVDMYSKEEMFKLNLEKFDISSFYFDKDSYYLLQEGEKRIYTGGPRKRVFNMECWLSKYPLFKLQYGEMQISAHYLSPYNSYEQYPFLFALLHFKFLTSQDLAKTKRYVKEKNHTNNSIEWKQYLKNYNAGANKLYYRNSVRYETSKSLTCINEIMRVSKI